MKTCKIFSKSLRCYELIQCRNIQWIIVHFCKVLIRLNRGQPTRRSFRRGLVLDKKKLAAAAFGSTAVRFSDTTNLLFSLFPYKKPHGIPPSNQDRGAEEGIKSQS